MIDSYLADFEKLLENQSSGLLASVPVHGPADKAMVAAHDADRQSPLTKYLDTFCFSKYVKQLESLHKKAAVLGWLLQIFNSRKGDMLIWHADLAHGGFPIKNPALTRRSYVSHYCGISRTPNYVQYLPEEKRLRVDYPSYGQFSTMYY